MGGLTTMAKETRLKKAASRAYHHGNTWDTLTQVQELQCTAKRLRSPGPGPTLLEKIESGMAS